MAFQDLWAPAAEQLPVLDTAQLRDQWSMYLNDPKTQSALLSFGAQAAQPRQFGQSNFGALMSSVAQGGAGVRATEELDRKQQETESKAQLRESQGMLAESRANVAGANAGTAAARLDLARQREEGLNERNRLGRQIQANRLYNEYVKTTNKANENATLFRRPTTPILSFDQWLQTNPQLLTNLGLTPDQITSPAPGSGGGDVTSPPSGTGPAPTQGQYPTPSAGAISLLRQRPELRNDFERRYGPGSAARYLAQ